MFTGGEARGGDGFEDDLQGFFVGLQIGREAAFIADGGGIAALVQDRFQVVKDLHAHAQRFGKTRCADGHDHEFLQVHGIIGVGAAIEDIHHGHGQRGGVALAGIAREIAIERQALGGRRGAGGGHGDGENGVGAQLAFVGRAVGLDHAAIERGLVADVEAFDGFGDGAVDVVDGFENAFAEIARFVAVAKLESFVFAGGGAGGHGGAAARAVREDYVGLDRGIAARIKNLPADDAGDLVRSAGGLACASRFAGVCAGFAAGLGLGLSGHVASGKM